MPPGMKCSATSFRVFSIGTPSGGNTVQLEFRRFRRDEGFQAAAERKEHVRRNRRFQRSVMGFQINDAQHIPSPGRFHRTVGRSEHVPALQPVNAAGCPNAFLKTGKRGDRNIIRLECQNQSNGRPFKAQIKQTRNNVKILLIFPVFPHFCFSFAIFPLLSIFGVSFPFLP